MNRADDDLRAEVLADLDAVERRAPEWDRLAVACGRPASLAGWQLAWWRQCAPPESRLHVVLVWRGERLVGLAPYAATPVRRGGARFRLLGAEITQRVEPLAEPGMLPAAASAIARTFAAGRPRVAAVQFDAADGGDAWLESMRTGWPGRWRPWVMTDERIAAPFVDLRHDSYDAWLAGKSANFRQQARRFRRRLLQAGGSIRMTTERELERDVDAFVRLHQARWQRRGGSDLTHDIAPMLREAGHALLPERRFRLWIVELDGRPIGAQLLLAAGREALYWNGGFDEGAADLKPALVALLAAVEDCIDCPELELLDLGAGAHDYKLRLSDGDRPLAWSVLVPRDRRHLANRLELLPRELQHHARGAFSRLPEPVQERVRPHLRRA